MEKTSLYCFAAACAVLAAGSSAALAEDAAPAAPVLQPTLLGPLAANPNPIGFDSGLPGLGKVYVSGVLSRLGHTQNHSQRNAQFGDRDTLTDISNGQVIVQTTEGLVQFYAQAGAYSMPALGTPYIRASKAIDNFYGPVPVAYVKLAPTDTLSLQVGKLPTLIGAEYTFTFQNPNIERGLLWNQENAISRGAQLNYTYGPLALSLAGTDGFYSGTYSWVSGAATYTFDEHNSATFVGGGNTRTTTTATVATPLPQQNQQIYNLIYTYNSAPWTITPYVQATYVPRATTANANNSASTYAGALTVTYAFDKDSKLAGVSLPVRFEYISSSGSAGAGKTNLLYGPGSKAWSLTATPTYQHGIYFVRGEASYVKADKITNGRWLVAMRQVTVETAVLARYAPRHGKAIVLS